MKMFRNKVNSRGYISFFCMMWIRSVCRFKYRGYFSPFWIQKSYGELTLYRFVAAKSKVGSTEMDAKWDLLWLFLLVVA